MLDILPDETEKQYTARVYSLFSRVVSQQARMKDRERENWRMYSGLYNGQWDREVVERLRASRRPVVSFNFIQGEVDTHVGVLMRNPLGTRFVPRNPEDADKVNLAQELFDYDYDRGKWGFEEAMFILGGAVFRGVAMHCLDYRHSPYGNPGWRVIDPLSVWIDQSWISYDIRECRYLFRADYKTADELIFISPNKKSEILSMANDALQGRLSYEKVESDVDYPPVMGDRFLVIEFHYLVNEDVEKLLDLETGSHMLFDDYEFKQRVLEKGKGRFKPISLRSRVSKYISFVPGLMDMVIGKGWYPIQMGRLPFDIWSSKTVLGEPFTLVDILKDHQRVVNKMEAGAIAHFTRHANTPLLVDSTFFPDDASKREVEKEHESPKVIWCEGGGRSVQDAVAPLRTKEFAPEANVGMQRILGYVDRASFVRAVMSAQASDKGYSGSHYNEILQASLAPFEIQQATLRAVFEARAEGYVKSAIYCYRDLYRELNTSKGVLKVNMPSEKGVENDVLSLERFSYIVEPAPRGENRRRMALNEITAQIQMTSNPLLRARLELKALEYRDDFSEEEKAQAIKEGEIYRELLEAQIAGQIQQIKASQAVQGQMMPGGIQGPREASRSPGMGPLPEDSGISGRQSLRNYNSPSDIVF